MKIAFDIKLMRPGCVLVAAAMGGDPQVANEFDTRDWLLVPTPNMGVYDVTPDQLRQLVSKVKAARLP